MSCRDANEKLARGLWRGLLGAAVLLVVAGNLSVALPDISQWIAQLAGKKWTDRSKAFYGLLKSGSESAGLKGPLKVSPAVAGLLKSYPQKAAEIKTALAKTLKAENAVVHGGASLPEDFSDYYGDLIQSVVALNDPGSVEALAGALGTGNMVNNALVSHSDQAVAAILQQTKSGERSIRQSACLVLQKMLDPANRNPIKDVQNKRSIQQALQDGPCGAVKRD